MKTVLAVTLLGILAVAIHGSLMPHFTIFGGRINILVAVVTAVALNYGAIAGLLAGLSIGLLADVVLSTTIGMSAIPLVITGYAVGYVARYFYRDAFLVPVVVGFLGAGFFEIVIWLLSNVAFAMWWRRAFIAVLIPTVLINGACMPLLHMWLARFLPKSGEEAR